jgi:hypothetical protein
LWEMCLASLMRASHARKGVPFSGVQPNPGHGASVSVFVHRQADFVMHGSPNNLRITWQFFDKDFLAVDAFKTQRNFHTYDEKYFDHFNLRVSEVGVTSAPLGVCEAAQGLALVVCHSQELCRWCRSLCGLRCRVHPWWSMPSIAPLSSASKRMADPL